VTAAALVRVVYRPLIFGLILVACMLFMPGGIVSALDARGGRRAS